MDLRNMNFIDDSSAGIFSFGFAFRSTPQICDLRDDRFIVDEHHSDVMRWNSVKTISNLVFSGQKSLMDYIGRLERQKDFFLGNLKSISLFKRFENYDRSRCECCGREIIFKNANGSGLCQKCEDDMDYSFGSVKLEDYEIVHTNIDLGRFL
ncbi:hypothetical protein ACHJH3_06790 [Campylobacter sp. MOP7]|uniref:hypothetical protein n=1 Tax=Campylobacter canis TaxID=3378588 RepID=UPI00387E309B